MYIHLGNEMVVNEKDIVGIFDLETTTISKHSRKFLEIAEKQKQVINVSYELPKSFILTSKNKENKVYISQISTATLQKRSKIL
ncbi:MAG: DUF370 domain-containing protein [Clostridia bacterium]|nr:DUF370 domain-containing protein [Clostridia bacterium]